MITNFSDIGDQPIRRYWVIAFGFYGKGGLNDVHGQHTTREDADKQANDLRDHYAEVEVRDIMSMISQDFSDPNAE
jgi:hypothetical protein